GRRGLLLQSLARLGDEPRVLHRDDGLRREVFQQRELLLRKGAYPAAINVKRAEEDAIFAQSHVQQAATAADIDQAPRRDLAGPVGVSIHQIRDVDQALAGNETLKRDAMVWPHRKEPAHRFGINRVALNGPQPEKLPVKRQEMTVCRLA